MAVVPYPVTKSSHKLVVCLKDINVAYGSLAALAGVNLDIHEGEIVGICGPNGSGKTTLLKVILGKVKPFKGSIKILGQDISQGLSKELKLKIGYVPQVQKIDRHFPATVSDVVMMGRYSQIGIGKRPSKLDKEIVHKALHDVHLQAFKDRPIGHLSGGQQQKVMIARALAQEPEILLLDEPTSALDFKIGEDLMNLIKNLNENKNLTIIMVQHNIKILQDYSDRLICLNVRMAYDGPPKDSQIPEIIQKVFFS